MMKQHKLVPVTVLALAFSLAVPGLFSARASEQAQQEQAKKKPRKVWTNDDFPTRPPQPEPAAEAAEPGKNEPPPPPSPDDALWAQLDDLKAELEVAQAEMERIPAIRDNYSRERLETTDPAWRNEMDEQIRFVDEKLAYYEVRIPELEQQIAELEKQLAGKKRPARRSPAPAPPPVATEGAEGAAPAQEPPPPQ